MDTVQGPQETEDELYLSVVSDTSQGDENSEGGGVLVDRGGVGEGTEDGAGRQQEKTTLTTFRMEMGNPAMGETVPGGVQVVSIVSTAVSPGPTDQPCSVDPGITLVPDAFPASPKLPRSAPLPVAVQSSTVLHLSVSRAAPPPSQFCLEQAQGDPFLGQVLTMAPSPSQTQDTMEVNEEGYFSVNLTDDGSVSEPCSEVYQDFYEQTGESGENRFIICEENSDVRQSFGQQENLQDTSSGKASDRFEHPHYDVLEVSNRETSPEVVSDDRDRLSSDLHEANLERSVEASDACEASASSSDLKSSSEQAVSPGQATFKSQVVMHLTSSKEIPQICSVPGGGEKGEGVAVSEGLGSLSPSPSSQQSGVLEQNVSDEGAGRGKRGDANGSGGLGLKEVEFKLDIGKRRLPSPDVKRASVEKERAPEFVVKPRRQFVDEGQNAKFKVAFEGSPSTTLSWSRNGKPLEPSKKFKMYEDSGYHYLEVCDVSQTDSGMYVGTIHNAAGTDTASAELDVFEKPKLLTRGSPPPTLSSSLQDLDVVIGDRDVKLQCEVKGASADRCTVTWFHNGREIRQGRQHRCVFTGKTASLTLTEVGEEDGGEYQCVIKNAGGEVSTSCTLSTQEGEKREPPVFIKELQDMEVEDGDKVELIVEVKDTDLDQEAEP